MHRSVYSVFDYTRCAILRVEEATCLAGIQGTRGMGTRGMGNSKVGSPAPNGGLERATLFVAQVLFPPRTVG